ncbi:MAG: imelysin family protein, partial [Balneolaceae bacterium]
DSTSADDEVDFDRAEMLENYGNNIILPAFEEMQSSVNALQATAEDFENDRSSEQLEELQSALKNTRLSWQKINLFTFGPSGDVLLQASLNTYPSDTDEIEENISSGDYSLGSIDNRDAAGLPALGYLLHGIGSDNEETLSAYTTDSDAENRMAYLLDNISFIKDLVDSAGSEWQASGGDYIGTFLSEERAGTDVGSSLGMLINSLDQHYERYMRDGKIGIPAGVRSAGTPRPAAVEAYHGGYSLELAQANLDQIEQVFTGGSGKGLDDNLEAHDAGELSEEIKAELDEARAALNTLEDPLSDQIEENNEPVLTAFDELQDLVALLKADMTSVLGITITFQDNDGD